MHVYDKDGDGDGDDNGMYPSLNKVIKLLYGDDNGDEDDGG